MDINLNNYDLSKINFKSTLIKLFILFSGKRVHNEVDSTPRKRGRFRGKPIKDSGAVRGKSVLGGTGGIIKQKALLSEDEEKFKFAESDVNILPGEYTINFDLGNQFHFEKILPDGSKVGR